MDLPSPEDVDYVLSLPFVVTYWPLILGALVLLLIMFKGRAWMMLPVGALFIILQLWRLGVFVLPG